MPGLNNGPGWVRWGNELVTTEGGVDDDGAGRGRRWAGRVGRRGREDRGNGSGRGFFHSCLVISPCLGLREPSCPFFGTQTLSAGSLYSALAVAVST